MQDRLVTDADTGDQLSTFSYKSGPYMTGYGTGTECDDSCTPTVSDQCEIPSPPWIFELF